MTHEYTLLVGGVVIAGDGERDEEALAWAADTILAVGSESEVRAISRGDSHVVRIAGWFVRGDHGRLEVGGRADLALFEADPRGGRAVEPVAVIRAGRLVAGTLDLHQDHVAAGAGPRLRVRPFTAADGREVARWRYEGPWSIYDIRDEQALSAALGYVAVEDLDTGELFGFACSGAEGRVPGEQPVEGVLDLGFGMAPRHVGRGLGATFGQVVVDHYEHAGAGTMRAVVQAWNERSQRLLLSLGFRRAGEQRCVQDGREVRYVVLVRGDDEHAGDDGHAGGG